MEQNMLIAPIIINHGSISGLRALINDRVINRENMNEINVII
jgi:hypothetical protein